MRCLDFVLSSAVKSEATREMPRNANRQQPAAPTPAPSPAKGGKQPPPSVKKKPVEEEVDEEEEKGGDNEEEEEYDSGWRGKGRAAERVPFPFILNH